MTRPIPAPEFPEGLDWINVPRPLTIAGDRLHFVDAESSAVRWADLATSFGERAVHTVVGTGLFDFRDRDGVGARSGSSTHRPSSAAATGSSSRTRTTTG